MTVLTVDVERDWTGSQTRGVHEALPWLLDLLAHHGATATFFVVGELAPLVRPMIDPDGPHEVGSHGLTHRRLDQMGPAQVWEEVRGSREALERAGYTIKGFRAPFFARPRDLDTHLARAGYAYDASAGRLAPSIRRAPTEPAVRNGQISLSTLRDGRTPFALTWLRLGHPVVQALLPAAGDAVFCCHLHELLDGSQGWAALPWPLRRLHRRGSGRTARQILTSLLTQRPATSCERALTRCRP